MEQENITGTAIENTSEPIQEPVEEPMEEAMEEEPVEEEPMEEEEEEAAIPFDPSKFLPPSVTTAIQNSLTDHARGIIQQHASQFQGIQEQIMAHQDQLQQLNQYMQQAQRQSVFFRDGYKILNSQ